MINRCPISEHTAQIMLNNPNLECRIDDSGYLIVNEEERHLIRERHFPAIPMETLDMLVFGKDYTMRGGIITLTNGEQYSLPLFA